MHRLIDAALIRFDPEEAARSARRAADGRGVWVGDQMTDGTRSIRIEADALDATAFDATVGLIADALGRLGVGDRPGAAHSSRRGPGRPRVVLYLHLHQDAVRTGAGVGRFEGLGPVTIEQVRDWAGRSDLTINRVIDLDDRTAVDAYETPDRIRETVILRNPCCPFPWCNNLSRNKDMDHVEQYVAPGEGGPPGQTAAHRLGPPCRRHHRVKTHGGWSYTQPEPGIYLWRSPHGRRYLVDHTGTAALSDTA